MIAHISIGSHGNMGKHAAQLCLLKKTENDTYNSCCKAISHDIPMPFPSRQHIPVG